MKKAPRPARKREGMGPIYLVHFVIGEVPDGARVRQNTA